MPQSLPFPERIAQDGYSRDWQLRVLSAELGTAGSIQVAPDGLNPMSDKITIQWIPLNTDDRNAVWTTFRAVGGWDYLTWQPPGYSLTHKFLIVPGSVKETASGPLWVITVQLREIP